MSGLIEKAKLKVAELKAEHGSNSGSTNAGPHSSNAANKADPRVDSDLDGGRHAGLNQTTGTHHTTGTGLTGTTGTHHTTGTGLTGSHHTTGTGLTGTTGTHHTTGTGLTGTTGTHHTTGTGVHGTSGIGSSGANTTAGPHDSNLANKIDPRVDSDLSGGHPGSNAAYTSTGTTGTTGSTFGTTGTHHTHGSTNAGPHNSNIANSVDPRVDSDLDGSRNAGLNQTTHGHSHGTHHTTGTGIGGTHTTGTGVGGTHTSNTTAGPHNSSLLNKLDPRVDSDLSGGHPGSNAAYTTTGTTGTSGTTGTY